MGCAVDPLINIISKLHAVIVKAAGIAKMTQQLAAVGAEPISNPRREFAAKIKADITNWGRAVKVSGASLE